MSRQKLLRIEPELHKRVISRIEPSPQLARAIRRSRAGLKSPAASRGSFVFLGPTVVGKTEVVDAWAEFLFGSEKSAGALRYVGIHGNIPFPS